LFNIAFGFWLSAIGSENILRFMVKFGNRKPMADSQLFPQKRAKVQ
jgi:hypothetical protein